MITCKTNELSNNLPYKIDYLLVCASYEDRCLTSYKYINPERVKNTAVFYFDQFYDNVINNANLLTQKFNAKQYVLDNSKPTSIADSIVDFLSNTQLDKGSQPKIVLDISTFTRESLLIILKYLYIDNDFSEIIAIYTSAEVSNTLSDVALNVRSVIGFMGDIKPEKPSHLIVISGFEYERAKEIIDTIEPDHITIVYGGKGESINDKIQHQNKIFTDKLIAYYSRENINVYTHTIIDIQSLKIKLCEIIHSLNDHNVIIAPLNNKLTTIAAGLAAIDNPDVQICYAQMANYNMANYSRTLDTCYIEKLFF